MRVVFFHRKPRAGNFSIENLFIQIRNALPREIEWSVKEMTFYSSGFFKRLYSCIEALFAQRGINHVTGDIHFIVLFLRKKKTVLTIHDLGLLGHSNAAVRMVLKWFWITLPVKRSAIITTVSLSTKRELLKHVAVDEQKVQVVYNPISPRFKPIAKDFNKKEPCILQIGTKYNKNIERLIEALSGVSCKLEITGRLSDKHVLALEKSQINYRISENLSDDEMVALYAKADIISFVSIFEGFGMPIIEGNAVGRVVVTSNVSSMPEIAGNAACMVDPFDVQSIRNGFNRVINDDEYRALLITKGFENIKRFDANAIAQRYVDLYTTLDF